MRCLYHILLLSAPRQNRVVWDWQYLLLLLLLSLYSSCLLCISFFSLSWPVHTFAGIDLISIAAPATNASSTYPTHLTVLNHQCLCSLLYWWGLHQNPTAALATSCGPRPSIYLLSSSSVRTWSEFPIIRMTVVLIPRDARRMQLH